MQIRFQCKTALFLIVASSAGSSHATMDIGLCPAVANVYDPNGNGIFIYGDNTKGMAAAEACIASGSKRGYTSRAYVQRRLGNRELATADLNTALAIGEEPYGVFLNRCIMAKIDNQAKTAITACNAAIDADPKQSGGYFNLALLFRSIKDYPAALDSIERAEKIDPNFAPIWQIKSLILRDLNRIEDANVALTRSKRLYASIGINAAETSTSKTTATTPSAHSSKSTLCPDGHDCTVIN